MDKRMAQHKSQHNISNGDDDKGNGDSGDSNDNDTYLGNGARH
jgi:hypothetical protein